MFERFTDRARRVVVLAQEEARMLSHNYIGTEHILLGLIHEGEGVAAKALESLRRDALALVDQPEQEVLGPDVVVVEHARFLLRKHDHATGPVGEPFKHLLLLPIEITSMLSVRGDHGVRLPSTDT